MDRDALEARVLQRLGKHAAYDPLAWLPVVGSTRQDGARHGLALELFCRSPRRNQLELLARSISHLASEGQIEIAQFAAGPVDGGPMPRQPLRQDDQTRLAFTLRPGSPGETFAVRLRDRVTSAGEVDVDGI
jgi:hypothetical protein